jgi:hypothetical protein
MQDGIFGTALQALEYVVFSETFQETQDAFFEEHCGNCARALVYALSNACEDVFEDTEENKLEYTAIFHGYTRTIGKLA